MIPQAAPQLRIQRYRAAVLAAIEETVDGGGYILGPGVARFEAAFACYCGARHCVAVNSGTDALAIALNTLGVGRGDEVITVSMTAPGTALAIRQCGAVPHFVDIDPRTRCLDVDAAAGAVGPRTRAIVPVHLHGYPMDPAPLLQLARRHNLLLVEDCAHAHGAFRDGRCAGTWGHAGVFSFYPTKNLGCLGDGGAILTDEDRLAARLRSVRSFETQGGTDHRCGVNSRLDELQARVLSVLLPRLDRGNGERAETAAWYRSLLDDRAVDPPPDHPGCVYHQFAIACEDREAVRRRLLEEQVGTGVHYAEPLHRHPAFADCPRGGMEVTESMARCLLSLPIQPEVVRGNEARIAAALRQALPRRRARAA